MLVAEVVSSGSGARLARAQEFVYPEGRTLREPEPLGYALGQFLKEQHFSTRTAVFGLPAKWVLSKRKEVPSANQQIIADTLRLQAESESSPELADMIYDYTGQATSNGANAVLLLGAPRKYLNQISTLAEAARLRVEAVMPSGAAVASATARSGREGMLLLVGPSGVEFTSQHEGSPRVLRYVGAATAPAPLLVGELRRATALVSQNGHVAANGHAARELVLWNDSGADETHFRALGDTLGMSVRDGALSDLGVYASDVAQDARDFAAPVSLALAGLSVAAPAIDFTHSRLAVAPPRRVERRTVLAIAVAALVVLVTVFWWYDLHARQAKLDSDQAALNNETKRRDAAKDFVTRVGYAGAWHREKPVSIACLRDLTLAFPEGAPLYATTLNLHPDELKGTLSGKAPDRPMVLKLLKDLRSGGHFAEVTLVQMEEHDSSKNGHEVAFTINFNYLPPK